MRLCSLYVQHIGTIADYLYLLPIITQIWLAYDRELSILKLLEQ